MSLKATIVSDMQKAAKERSSLALSALRMAIAAIKNREIEARGELPDADILKVLSTMIKQRREAADLYRKGNRPELAEKEEGEVLVIQKYLPRELSAAELEALARETIAAAGAKGPGDTGRVMKELMPRVAGRADGKAVGELVRRLLTG